MAHPEPEYQVDLNGDGVVYTPNPAFGKWRRDPISTTPQQPGLALGALWATLVRPFVLLSAGQFRTITPPSLVNVALADAGIATRDSKYHFEYWRPVTGIRQGRNDGNPNTTGDPNFHPLGAPASNTTGPNFTPPFPAYTSGHATFGGALFQVLRRFYRTDAISFSFISDEFNGVTRDNQGNVRPLVVRHFPSLKAAEEENGQSRIYLGIHWSFDKTEGIRQGNRVADRVFNNSFRKRTFGGVLTPDDDQ